MDNKLEKSKILITGGAGFIGSNLVEHFLNQNNEVVCLDNLSTGYLKNIEPFFCDKNFTFLEGDIRDLGICKKAVKGCEFVFHEAALGSVPRSIKDPATTNAVNIDGFLNMLIASRDENVKRFIYASSSSVYGDSKELPKVEEKIGNPLSPYAITKLVNEQYARVFSELYGMETIGLRYFNVFGKRQDPNGVYAAVIPLWIKKILNNERPVINGDGSYSRDFTYINNVIHANEMAAIFETTNYFSAIEDYFGVYNSKSVYEVFNVAFGQNTNLNSLFKCIVENLIFNSEENVQFKPIYGPNRQGDIQHSLASINKISRVINYNPKYDFNGGIIETCNWFINNRKAIS